MASYSSLLLSSFLSSFTVVNLKIVTNLTRRRNRIQKRPVKANNKRTHSSTAIASWLKLTQHIVLSKKAVSYKCGVLPWRITCKKIWKFIWTKERKREGRKFESIYHQRFSFEITNKDIGPGTNFRLAVK